MSEEKIESVLVLINLLCMATLSWTCAYPLFGVLLGCVGVFTAYILEYRLVYKRGTRIAEEEMNVE